MKRRIATSGAVVLVCCAGTCQFGIPGANPLPAFFQGRYALSTKGHGPNTQIRIENNAIVAFIENGVEKQLTAGGSIQQLSGRINYLTLSGFMTPFPGRTEEQWTVSFSGDENDPGKYEGTIVYRLTARIEEFAHYPAEFERVGE